MGMLIMEPASRGGGNEEYKLRYPVDLDRSFSLPRDTVDQMLGTSAYAQMERTPYGFMFEIAGFATEVDARRFAMRLELELRKVCIERRLSMFFPAEIYAYEKFEVPVLLPVEMLGKWQKNHAHGIVVDGRVPTTMACIVPEHLKIVYLGEIRGGFSIVVPMDKIRTALDNAFSENLEELGVNASCLHERHRLAADFFSLACAHGSPFSRVIHLVICLEILAAAVGIGDNYIHGTRKLFSRFDVEKIMPQIALGRNARDMELSHALHAIRGDIVHRGYTASPDVDRILNAGMDAAGVVLVNLLDQYRDSSRMTSFASP
ncbi:hypothetical protein [Lysobacter hankyongensis]